MRQGIFFIHPFPPLLLSLNKKNNPEIDNQIIELTEENKELK
jgi:hypothetical protein